MRRDVYGQEVLEGLNWDLIWVFAGIAVAIILVHLVVSGFGRKR